MLKSFIMILLTSLLTTAQTQPPAGSKSGSITGKVVNERGEPLPNARVLVQAVGAARSRANAITDSGGTFTVDGLEPVRYQMGAPASADERGNFSLINLAPAQYYFAARFPAKSWYLQSISLTQPAGKPIDATRVWTTIKSGDHLSGLTVTLAQGAASLRGQVVFDATDRPAKWLAYLVPAEPEHANNLLRFHSATVSPEGKIQFVNLAPGRYRVLVQPVNDDAFPQFRIPDETEIRAKLRRDAEELKTEIELKPCQDLVDFKITVKNQ